MKGNRLRLAAGFVRAWSVLTTVRTGLDFFVLTRFLYANRCPLRSKTL